MNKYIKYRAPEQHVCSCGHKHWKKKGGDLNEGESRSGRTKTN